MSYTKAGLTNVWGIPLRTTDVFVEKDRSSNG